MCFIIRGVESSQVAGQIPRVLQTHSQRLPVHFRSQFRKTYLQHVLCSSTAVALTSLYFTPTIIASPVTSQLAPTNLARDGQILAQNDSVHDLYLKDDDGHKVADELEKAFEAIHDIPDEILEKDDDETDKWLIEHGHCSKHDKRDLLDRGIEDRGFWDVVRCVGAIAAFIASNSIGAAKLLRIKEYIEALGGVRASAELLLKASTTAERLKEGGEALALLAGEFLGVSLISNNC